MPQASYVNQLIDTAIDASPAVAEVMALALLGAPSEEQSSKLTFINDFADFCCKFPRFAAILVYPASLLLSAVNSVESDSQLRTAALHALNNIKMMIDRTKRERLTQSSQN